jgi:hypothetical protein
VLRRQQWHFHTQAQFIDKQGLICSAEPTVVGTGTRRPRPATLAILCFAQQEPPTLLSGYHHPLESLFVRHRAFANLALCSPA